MASYDVSSGGDMELQNNIIRLYGCLNSQVADKINEFTINLPDIVQDKEAFTTGLIEGYCRKPARDCSPEAFLGFAMEVVRSAAESLPEIKTWLLGTSDSIKIADVRSNFVKKSAVITFTNNEKIIYKYSVVKNDYIFNNIIDWLNSRVGSEYRLYARKLIVCGNHGFLEYIQASQGGEEELSKRFFSTGELLALLYILNCSNLKCKRFVTLARYPVLMNLDGIFLPGKNKANFNLSSKSIAKDIIDSSVYNIDFIPKQNRTSAKLHIASIKGGFRYMYNIIVQSKREFIEFLNSQFAKDTTSYLPAIITKIYGLNDDDLKRQLHFLDVRFEAGRLNKTGIAFSPDSTAKGTDREYFLDIATRLGDHMIQKSIIGFNNFLTTRTWINTVKHGKKLIVSPQCYNLYEGNSGIALFFLYLGELTKKEYFINTAVEAMREPISHIDKLQENTLLIGAFRGISGELYTLSKIYSVTRDDSIKAVIRKGLNFIDAGIYKQNNMGFFDGLSGVLAVLLSICENKDFVDIRGEVLSSAQLAYRQLASNIGWVDAAAGFGSGCSGIIAALLRLWNMTEDPVVRITIKELLKKERLFLDNERLQDQGGWKNGYSGILLSRLVLKKAGFDDALLDEEISRAMHSTIKHGFGCSPFYCNGDIGSLEIMDCAAELLRDTELKERCNNTLSTLVGEIIEPSIRAETKSWNKSISLLKGISGYGYILLRKYGESYVPQILLLE